MRTQKTLTYFITSAIISLFSISTSHAAVAISELYPAPPAGENEWIELANTSNQQVYLSGWELWDTITTPSKILTIPDSTILPAHTFLVFKLPTAKLNNAGDGVTLRSPDGEIVDLVEYENAHSEVSFTRNGLSSTLMTSDTPSPGSDSVAWPLLSESHPSPTPQPEPAVTLTSFLACPTSGNEWVELYSTGDTVEINDWIIRDAAGNTRKLNGVLPPHTLTQLSWSGAILGNSGDSFTISTDTGEIIGTATFNICTPGLPHVYAEQDWIQLQDHITPIKTSFTTPAPSPTATHTPEASALPSPESTLSLPAPRVLSAQDDSFTLPQHTLESMRTNAERRNLTLELDQAHPPVSILISAIIGGLLLAVPGGVLIYVYHFKKRHTETL